MKLGSLLFLIHLCRRCDADTGRCLPLIFWTAALLLLCGKSYAADEIMIEGRIFTQHGSLLDATASVYTSYEDILNNKPFRAANPTDAFGMFRMAVPPGRYYFTARGRYQGREYAAFHGSNPVSLQHFNARIGLMAHPVSQPIYTAGSGELRGSVTFKGKPLANGYVTAYLPTAETFKGLGVKTVSLRENGTFTMQLPQGKYVITAKKTASNRNESGLGPPKFGDLIGYFTGNPVEIRPDQDVFVEVPCYPKGDRPSFDDITVTEFWPSNHVPVMDLAAVASFGVKGRVIDVQGRPIQDIFVQAYKTEEKVFQMFHLSHGTPNTMRTDGNGEFFIPLEESGDYYVVARNTLGNAPHRDEIYGLYQGHPMHRLSYRMGEIIEGITIVAGITMDAKVDPQKNQGPEHFADHAINGDLTIERDTIWSGTILINGVVSIRRGVTLTIEPGATVRFKRHDRDNNSIGDGEILVEGRLVAEGKPDRKIFFTSAEDKPAPRDWSYINILSTSGENIFRYCVFEFGFSGMQIHFSNAKVFDSLFHKNGEGLHFNTANLEASRNTFTNNGVGIKFSRLEGNVLVSNNTITENDIGVQFVHQHINAVDFDNIHKVIELPLFVANNINDNRKYNFSMGELQIIDINVKGNWWGSTDPAEIGSTIFDKLDDKELGEVLFSPHLSQPVLGAGLPDNR